MFKLSERQVEERKYEAFQRICDRLFDRMEEDDFFSLYEIEKIILLELLPRFTRADVARIIGVSPRSITNKMNSHKLKHLVPAGLCNRYTTKEFQL